MSTLALLKHLTGIWLHPQCTPEGAQAPSGTPAPPPQVLQLYLEAEARAEIIFNFAADAFDIAEFFYDFVLRAGCKGARTPAAQPMTRARAALTRACARGLMARSMWLVWGRARGRRSRPGCGWRPPCGHCGPERPQGGRRAQGGHKK